MATRAEMEAVLKFKEEGAAKIAKMEKDLAGVQKQLTGTTKKTRGFGSGIKDATQKLTGFKVGAVGAAAAVAAVGAGITKAVKDTVRFGSELTVLRDKTGLSLSTLQEMRFAAEQAGVGFDKVTDASLRLGRRTAARLPEATKAVDALGLSLNDIIEMKPDEQFRTVVESLSQVGNQSERAAAAMAIFGDAGLQVLPLLNQNLDQSIERFRALGGVIDDDVLEAGRRLDDQLRDLQASWEVMKAVVAGPVINALVQLTDFMQRDLLTILAEVKASWLENAASALDAVEAINRVAALLPGVGDMHQQVADAAHDMAAGFRTSATDARANAEEMVAAIQQTRNMVKVTGDQRVSFEKLNTTVMKFNKTIKQSRFDYAGLREVMIGIDIPQRTREWEGLIGKLPEVDKNFQRIGEQMATAKTVSTDWLDVMSELRGLFNLFSIDADSVLGRILGTATKIVDTLNSVSAILSAFSGGGGGGIGSLLGGLVGRGGAGTGAATSAAGGGAGIGGALAGFLTNPLTLAIGGGLGVGALLAKLFGKEANIAETVEREFRVPLGDALKSTLENIAVQRGDLSSTAQLAIGDIFREAIASGNVIPADNIAEEIADIFSFLDRKEISKPEAITAIEDAIPLLIERLGDLGPEGQQQIERIIGAAERFGLVFEGLDELINRVRGNLGSIDLGGFGGGFGGNNIVDFTSAQGGFKSSSLPRDRLIMAHKDEAVNIGTPAQVFGAGGGGGGNIVINLDFSNSVTLENTETIARKLGPTLAAAVRTNQGGFTTEIKKAAS